MKSSAGWGAALLLAVATWFGISRSGEPNISQEPPSAGAALNASSPLGKTTNAENPAEADNGCQGIQNALRAFFSSNLNLDSFCPGVNETGQSTSTGGEQFANPAQPIFLIAMLPDPIHTHLADSFDQATEAIQHAAADEGYTYDSSWMPWQKQNDHYLQLGDALAARILEQKREMQPGILLFRHATSSELERYRDPLIIFIVGEQPTAGVNKAQFEDALRWVQALNSDSYPDRLRILGSFSSGALDSLAQVIDQVLPCQPITPAAACDKPQLLMASGTASSKDLIESFGQAMHARLTRNFVNFAGWTNLDIRRYLRLLMIQGYNTGQVALIAEDETGFGESVSQTHTLILPGCIDDEELCRPGLVLGFPRNVASLRSAYQRQGLLSQRSSEAERSAVQPRLAEESSESHEIADDTIQAYSESELNLSDESELLQIVLQLRQSHIQYLILAGSNIYDVIFLAKFFRNAYPEGRIVIAGSDQLLFRDRGPGNLRGILTLSPYPLSPEVREWTLSEPSPYRKIYTSHEAQGTYYAARYLVRYDRQIDLPDYGAPSWLRDSGQVDVPPTWLSVISSGRPWPVAALNRGTLDSLQSARHTPSRKLAIDQSKQDEEPFETAAALSCGSKADATPPKIKLTVPVEFRITVIACVLWAAFHWYFRWNASLVNRPRWRAYFCMIDAFQHALTINLGWACIGCAALSLWWFTSGCDEVVRSYKGWGVCLLFVIGASSAAPWADWLRNTDDYPAKWVGALIAGISTVVVVVYYVVLRWCLSGNNAATSNALHWRAMHLLSGVSPAVPLTLLCIGGYLWSFESIHGCALMNLDRPQLPLRGDLELDLSGVDPCPKSPNAAQVRDRALALRMFSREAYQEIETNALPLSWAFDGYALLIAALLFVAGSASKGSPLASLGPHSYAQLCGTLMILLVSIALAEAWQLWRMWRKLQELLSFLDRLMLRRTLRAIKDFSWVSIWYMSGAVLEYRYQILSRQIETLRHVENAWENFHARGSFKKDGEVSNAIKQLLEEIECHFRGWFSKNYLRDGHIDLAPVQELQCKIAWTSAVLLRKVLIPEWRGEMDSLVIAGKRQGIAGAKSEDIGQTDLPLPPSPLLRSAEEFVCLNYLAFIQNVMGRMRTLVAGMGALFVATALSASLYPLDPRPLISEFFVIAFVVLASSVIIVFAQAHRDATLSNITNTTPGDLGGDFYLKVIQFAIGPALGLLSVLFPSIADFLFSWIQPGQMR